MTSSAVEAESEVRSSGQHVRSDRGRSAANISSQRQTMPVTHYNTFNGPFFWTTRSPRRQYFVIHPEWASENIVPATWHHDHRQQQAATDWTPPHTGRRCRSAPPGTRSRNPITWENWWSWLDLETISAFMRSCMIQIVRSTDTNSYPVYISAVLCAWTSLCPIKRRSRWKLSQELNWKLTSSLQNSHMKNSQS